MQVKLGCNPLTWSGKNGGFEVAVRDIAAIGFQGVEPPVGAYLERLEELKNLIQQNQLQCASAYTSGAFENSEQLPELITKIVRVAAALPDFGCDRIILSAGGRGTQQGEFPDETIERFADGVNECARQCYEKHGVKSVFHNHAWTLIESPHEVDLFMELTDPYFVLAGFDTAQLAYGGYEPAEAFRKWRTRIGYVHIKDNNPALPTAMPIAEKNALRDKKKRGFHVFWPLGQGALGDAGLDAVLDVLREINYQGWIVNELDSTSKSPREANTANYEWLTKHIRPEERNG
ncbi:MAG: TIM barrel protein [Abitibacteriaceae bacterium]|nr:TIM barrel protein [Abditibacteriaceae bacterium]